MKPLNPITHNDCLAPSWAPNYIKTSAPVCDMCQKSDKVVNVIPYFEWYCKRCNEGWMGSA